jgi:hypothetical protein
MSRAPAAGGEREASCITRRGTGKFRAGLRIATDGKWRHKD